MGPQQEEIDAIKRDWETNPRWRGIKRGYGAQDVVRLRGSVQIEHTLAKLGAEKLWKMCGERPFVNSLGALTGNQAMQQVRAGVPAIYLSGWQVAADANDSLSMYPDQSLYAVSSVPTVVRRINNALARQDQIQTMEGKSEVDWFAPIVADAVWCETGTPDLEFARRFAEGIRRKFPEKMLAYNCSPSFNWKRNLDDGTIGRFQRELGAMGYKYQFITLAGFHALNYSMFELAHGYARDNMSAFVALQEKEFAAAEKGFTAVKHQREVGTGYFDQITQVVTAGKASTTALHGSTEDAQFFDSQKKAKLALA